MLGGGDRGPQRDKHLLPSKCTVPEFIDPVFTKTSPKRSFSLNRKRAFWLVFAKTASIISGTGQFLRKADIYGLVSILVHGALELWWRGRELRGWILSPWPGYIVDYGTGLSNVWWPVRQPYATINYIPLVGDIMAESTLSPSQGSMNSATAHSYANVWWRFPFHFHSLRTLLHFINLFLCLRATCELCGPNLSSPPPQPSTKQSETQFFSAICVYVYLSCILDCIAVFLHETPGVNVSKKIDSCGINIGPTIFIVKVLHLFEIFFNS